MAFPVDTADWRATLDSIVAATDNNLRAIRGLADSSGRRTPPAGGVTRGPNGNGTPASPISVPSTPPPWTSVAPSQDAVYNAVRHARETTA